MHIEQSFRDYKSGSFDLEATKLTDPERLNHLLLAIAVATLGFMLSVNRSCGLGSVQRFIGLQASTKRFRNRLAASCAVGLRVKLQGCRS